MPAYCTSFCNQHHDTQDGKPIGHECYILPPEAIQAERDDDFETAQRLINDAKHLPIMRRGKLAANNEE